MVLSLVLFARTILDGLLYTIVKLFWKLIQSRIVRTLVLVDIFWFREQSTFQSYSLWHRKYACAHLEKLND